MEKRGKKVKKIKKLIFVLERLAVEICFFVNIKLVLLFSSFFSIDGILIILWYGAEVVGLGRLLEGGVFLLVFSFFRVGWFLCYFNLFLFEFFYCFLGVKGYLFFIFRGRVLSIVIFVYYCNLGVFFFE